MEKADRLFPHGKYSQQESKVFFGAALAVGFCAFMPSPGLIWWFGGTWINADEFTWQSILIFFLVLYVSFVYLIFQSGIAEAQWRAVYGEYSSGEAVETDMRTYPVRVLSTRDSDLYITTFVERTVNGGAYEVVEVRSFKNIQKLRNVSEINLRVGAVGVIRVEYNKTSHFAVAHYFKEAPSGLAQMA